MVALAIVTHRWRDFDLGPPEGRKVGAPEGCADLAVSPLCWFPGRGVFYSGTRPRPGQLPAASGLSAASGWPRANPGRHRFGRIVASGMARSMAEAVSGAGLVANVEHTVA